MAGLIATAILAACVLLPVCGHLYVTWRARRKGGAL